MDDAGLFGATDNTAPGSPSLVAPAAGSGAAARRTKLYPWDSVASQLLEPYGSSVITKLKPEQVWKAAASGNKKCMYHSHFAAEDEWGVGAGISITAETLLEGIKQLKDNNIKELLKEVHYKKAMAEADKLKPTLEILCFGKGGRNEDTVSSFSSLKKKAKHEHNMPAVDRSEASIRDAAGKLWDWLKLPTTPLRAILSMLAAGGSFYTSHCAEKVARSCVLQKPSITQESFQAAAVARSKSTGEPVTGRLEGDTGGLIA
jgi:hypothetical protein